MQRINTMQTNQAYLPTPRVVASLKDSFHDITALALLMSDARRYVIVALFVKLIVKFRSLTLHWGVKLMQGIFSSSRANRLRLVLPSFPTFHRDDAKINPFSANQFERIIDLDDMIEAELIYAPAFNFRRRKGTGVTRLMSSWSRREVEEKRIAGL